MSHSYVSLPEGTWNCREHMESVQAEFQGSVTVASCESSHHFTTLTPACNNIATIYGSKLLVYFPTSTCFTEVSNMFPTRFQRFSGRTNHERKTKLVKPTSRPWAKPFLWVSWTWCSSTNHSTMACQCQIKGI